MLLHPFAPSNIDKDSKILILGSFPSVASREMGFYYAHLQNRFWKVLGALFGDETIYAKFTKLNKEERQQHIKMQKAFLQSHSIVLWDIVYSCDITGSSDSSLKNIAFNDIFSLLTSSEIRAIFLNGTKATTLFQQYCKNLAFPLKIQACLHYKILTPTQSLALKFTREIRIFSLPSTSPANAKYSLDSLIDSWCILLDFCG
ncbi:MULTISPECIES: DNA-deoxyinosine glycosylase [Helicobacter]|uniref:DNA-deoxyinosine glycosylase n=1 Tax=Helicobacter TaxID=209 RepID=UPI00051CD9D9|nr:DNA-deoxyinosine glycosylase [Helicobacter sp. MIT 03-1616]TLD87635.1 DNA-deoxyinosine glycosylase [Helicobacter sp. MIT 03-1616]